MAAGDADVALVLEQTGPVPRCASVAIVIGLAGDGAAGPGAKGRQPAVVQETSGNPARAHARVPPSRLYTSVFAGGLRHLGRGKAPQPLGADEHDSVTGKLGLGSLLELPEGHETRSLDVSSGPFPLLTYVDDVDGALGNQ